MPSQEQTAFLQVWPKCFLIFLGIIELLAAAVLIFTEICNVGASFWLTNVFAGGWCGLFMLIHFIALFVAGCCSPGPAAAFRAVVITIIALVACAALISFDALFIAQPSTCILTSSCSSNVNSTTIFSYTFQTSFFSIFNGLSTFKNYSQTQTKFLFQTIQLGVGCLCFVLCIVYLIIYYVSKNKSSKQVGPSTAPQQDYYDPQANSRQPRAPQPYSNGAAWSGNRRY